MRNEYYSLLFSGNCFTNGSTESRVKLFISNKGSLAALVHPLSLLKTIYNNRVSMICYLYNLITGSFKVIK